MITLSGISQQSLPFSYDSCGNQIRREFICINCPVVEESEAPEELEASHSPSIEEAPLKFSEAPEALLSYHPNPTREELHMNWENTPSRIIESIDVFTPTGQQVQSFPNLLSQTRLIIPFITMPVGSYYVQLHYQSGHKKALHIIKK